MSIQRPRLRGSMGHDRSGLQASTPRGPAKAGSTGALSRGVAFVRFAERGCRDGQAQGGSNDKGATQTRATIQTDLRGCHLDEESRISLMEGVLVTSLSSL